MKIEMKYKGRRFSSVSSMMKAMERDAIRDAKRNIERQARLSGLRTRKTADGFKMEGNEAQIKRFKRRIEK